MQLDALLCRQSLQVDMHFAVHWYVNARTSSVASHQDLSLVNMCEVNARRGRCKIRVGSSRPDTLPTMNTYGKILYQ